jgi:D-alanyl-D-alanine carboxypeptidase
MLIGNSIAARHLTLGARRSVLRSIHHSVLGLFTVSITLSLFAGHDTAEARRYRHRHHQHIEHDSYSPAFSSIIVDANSGAVLQSKDPDGPRHPASLTKIMTLYLLFERLESNKLRLDSMMDVSENASEQAPTKLGLKPGQSIRVEDAIKGLVTRSANDAAVVIAETISGSEEDFAKAMTRKARALGMSRTTYKNASGLPDDDQITTARDQATLGRAIQDRFPKYYRYFATDEFNYRGHVIRNHNHLLGRMEGVDGIKTGYTRASGFNLVTSMKRGNRFLVGVVMGGRSGSSRDAIMRNLLAEHLDEAATKRTVAAVTERGADDVRVADAKLPEPKPPEAKSSDSKTTDVKTAVRPAPTVQIQGAVQVASPEPEAAVTSPPRAPVAQSQQKAPPPLTSGVIASSSFAAIPGGDEPMKTVRVKTVQVRMGGTKVASAVQSAPSATSALPPPGTARVAETSKSVVAKAENTVEASDQTSSAFPAPIPAPPSRSTYGIGAGTLGAVPASSTAPRVSSAATPDPWPRGAAPTTLNAQAQVLQQTASADPQAATATSEPVQTIQQNGAIKPITHSGWIIQVGALESEAEARLRLDAARGSAKGLLGRADPFTETVSSKGDRTLYRARFAGLDRDTAEQACRALKRSEISCFAVKN